MKNRVLKSVAVLGTVTLVGLFLVACGSKSSNKDAAASNEITAYVDEGYKSYMEEVAKAYEKETGTKVTIKTGDALTGLDNLSLDNQSGKSPDVMMAPYDRVGSLLPLDLHVLGTPPAFILSQDQTLHKRTFH